MMVVDQVFVRELDRFYDGEQGRNLLDRQERLIRLLVRPVRGERVLYAGITTGQTLAPFLNYGCLTTAYVPAQNLAEAAAGKTGQKVDFRVGPMADFPFSDNEFDLVVLQAALEFTPDYRQLLDEAIRVSQGRVLLVVKNRGNPFFPKNISQALFPRIMERQARSFFIWELLSLVRSRLGAIEARWGSDIFCPYLLGKKIAALEGRFPVRKNPFGACLVICFPVSFRLRTLQDVIQKPSLFKEGGREPARGLVRGG